MTTESEFHEAAASCRRALDRIDTVLVGARGAARLVLLGILAGGHVLLEDVPGVGKTLLARSIAATLGLRFTRIQFTPDLLPADLIGAEIFDPAQGRFVIRHGPIVTQLLLADEINRTPPKTQSALLEAMAEGQVTVAGATLPLPEPFVVLATGNPLEYEGTYPLPEAQLDRFALRVRLGYLDEQHEVALIRRRVDRGRLDPPSGESVLSAADVLATRAMVDAIEMVDDLVAYLVAVVRATREHPSVQLGASPRAALDLAQLARAGALLDGRTFVVPENVQSVLVPALAHRITLRPEAWVRRVDPEDVVWDVLRSVPAPRTAPSP